MTGRHTRTWVTRKIGLEEVFHEDCVEPKQQRRIGWMFWGCISGKYGKGLGVFWEKEWGSITAESYSRYIVPRIAEYLREHPGLIFQQDNAPGHKAVMTREAMDVYGFRPIWWPPNSPDLSPIESIWDEQKDWMQDYDSKLHRNYGHLRTSVEGGWESITLETIQYYISTMPERCEAVIAANGGPTKF